jgi:hypothetical protein
MREIFRHLWRLVMSKGGFVAGVCGVGLLLAVAIAAPAPKPDPKKDDGENKNTLIQKYKDKLQVTASSFFQGYPADRVIDGDKQSSWYSAVGDSAAQGRKPWIMVAFPEDVNVTRFTVLGNRDPNYPLGYSVLTGLAEFLDADGKVLWNEERDAAGDLHDFDFKPKELIKKVRSVRFTSVKDEGNVNGSQDIAIAEILID